MKVNNLGQAGCLDKATLLQLVIRSFPEEINEAVNYESGEVCIDYVKLDHKLKFDLVLLEVDLIYSPKD
ncbi:hypothetical protein JCM19240_4321 [Vibrio maritimus]|uniref:Uncharacterized protein n=1 Tax=Vibrio maritimus TaxID=990268 RepID=A0A090T495_9VIBR|nr:hypothetical protein JCM19240_4321 [Vibrio maritimus]